ncbi:unnamed protein product [Peniophora sp. CBMAI 1063]|nr:unnamed protein product [Peniophora sp. CBMAI 1063]
MQSSTTSSDAQHELPEGPSAEEKTSEERPAKRLKAAHDEPTTSTAPIVRAGMPYNAARTSARPRVPSLPRLPRLVFSPRAEQPSRQDIAAASISFPVPLPYESIVAIQETNKLSDSLTTVHSTTSPELDSTPAVSTDTDPTSLQQKYRTAKHERDVVLRGFRALQALRSRDKMVAQSPEMLDAELATARQQLETARAEVEESVALQEALRRQWVAAEAKNESVQEELETVRDELKTARLAREKTQAQRDDLQALVSSRDAELNSLRVKFDMTAALSEKDRADLDSLRAELRATKAELAVARSRKQTETSAKLATLPPEDDLMGELEASLQAVKQGVGQHQAELAHIPDLQAQIRTLESERGELMGWKQEAISIRQEVTERENEAVEWERKYEVRGVRLGTVIRELRDLRARVGW